MTVDELKAKHIALCHAMQSGVAYNHDTADQTPKHLRVGVNSALISVAALGELMVSKGLITEQEYWQSLVDGMAKEVADYEGELTKQYGKPVKLG